MRLLNLYYYEKKKKETKGERKMMMMIGEKGEREKNPRRRRAGTTRLCVAGRVRRQSLCSLSLFLSVFGSFYSIRVSVSNRLPSIFLFLFRISNSLKCFPKQRKSSRALA